MTDAEAMDQEASTEKTADTWYEERELHLDEQTRMLHAHGIQVHLRGHPPYEMGVEVTLYGEGGDGFRHFSQLYISPRLALAVAEQLMEAVRQSEHTVRRCAEEARRRSEREAKEPFPVSEPSGPDIQEVKAKTDFLALVSEHVWLRKKGRRFEGQCPFCGDETSSSFALDLEEGLWHCFACKAGGDVFSFVELLEKVGLSQAVDLLAARAGLTYTNEEPGEEVSSN